MKEEKIKVLALLPMELPKEIELDNTLEAMQKFVDGNIECLTFYDSGSIRLAYAAASGLSHSPCLTAFKVPALLSCGRNTKAV